MFFQSGSASACFQTVVSLWQCINWRNKDEKEKFNNIIKFNDNENFFLNYAGREDRLSEVYNKEYIS